MLKIFVCLKQVPATNKVEVDPETGVLRRNGVESKMNPYDLYALETALRLREEKGAHVVVGTMGPPQAAAVIREAYMMGADEGYVFSDRRLGGADVLATSYTLSQAIQRIEAKIRVSRPGGAPMIVFAAGIRVGNQDGQGCAGGTAFEDAADDAEGVGFLPGGRDGARGTAKRQLGRDEGCVHGKARGEAVEYRADFGTVAFAEKRHDDAGSKGVFHGKPRINS